MRPNLSRVRHLQRVLAILALTAMGGCGGADAEGGRSATVPAGQTVRVTGSEYAFDPENVVIDGGGEAVAFSFANEGSLAHNLKVFRGDDELGGTATFEGGKTETAEVALEPGSYRLVCTVGDHEALGMVGTLDVR